MKRNRKRIIAAVAVICALAAGGAAFTYSNGMPSENVAGYGQINVTGATLDDIHNQLSTDGQYITKVVITFHSAIPADATVVAGWGDTADTAPTNLDQTCTQAVDHLSATCGDGTTNLTQVSNANSFAVAVSH
jgi:hypothetical protein